MEEPLHISRVGRQFPVLKPYPSRRPASRSARHPPGRVVCCICPGGVPLVPGGIHDPCTPGRAVSASFETPGSKVPALGQQRELRWDQHLNFWNQSIAAAKLTAAARSTATRITLHAERVSLLQRLNGRVERVAHVRLQACYAIYAGARTHAAGRGFVGGEASPGARVNARGSGCSRCLR
jgi:hypothetical protein